MVWALLGAPAEAQRRRGNTPAAATTTYDESLYSALEWRNIGPHRGGRSAAVTGVPGSPKLFYMGSTGGGVWRTQDGGQTWENISDGFFGGSIGAVAVSEYDNNVIYVGGGEVTVRGNVSSGHGMWRSVDAGKTWEEIGMKDARHIPRIRIHPRNPDIVYAAVLGDLYKDTPTRGIYRSKDGGQTWQKIHSVDNKTGAVDLAMDPNNPRILFASMWQVRRTPYSLESGGPGSSVWKSTDGGDTWKEISRHEGLPQKGILGISGISVSKANSERVYLMLEHDQGGLFRSDDGGDTWTKVNSDRSLRQRAWYYTRVYADTQDEDIVYVMNVSFHRSTDGGRSFERYGTPHGDHHDLWIAPEDNQRLIVGDDGGAQVSYDAAENWSTYHNQPTAQFYRVTTDNHFPYRIYGAQQDNSTVRIPHRTDGYSIGEDDWESTAGGESAHIAIDPRNNEVVYGGSYGGFLSRVDHRNGQNRIVNVWPDNPMGYGSAQIRYRFQWNFPILISAHNPDKVWAASQFLHQTTDGGQSWTTISPDLTRNDSAKGGASGGPITKDNTGVEYYSTIFAVEESPSEEGVIWVGSDDGRLHITRNGGANWSEVTPPGAPTWIMWNCIDADPHNPAGAYVAGTLYKGGDYAPYLYKTTDYGKTWTKIVQGISAEHFTRAIRVDPERQGLLYAGTEAGMYISFDDGASWKPFQLNMPMVPITDLAIKNNNLIAATQGRSFWMIDDLTPLHQLSQSVASSSQYLFKPMDSYRMSGGQGRPSLTEGMNHPGGVMVHYYLKEVPDTTVMLEFLEPDGDLIMRYTTAPKKGSDDEELDAEELEAGMNRLVWNMRYPGAERFDGLIMWAAGTAGPTAAPGNYKVRLTVGDYTQEQDFTILAAPRSETDMAGYQAQFDYLIAVRDKVTETHQAIKDIRQTRSDMNRVSELLEGREDAEDILEMVKEINKAITEVEEELYQTKNRSNQDPLNYPIKLNNRLAALGSQVGYGNYPPTNQAEAFRKEVTELIDEQLRKWYEVRDQQVPELNNQIKDLRIDYISVPERDDEAGS